MKIGDRVTTHPTDDAATIEDMTGIPGVVPGLKGTVVEADIENVWPGIACEVRLDAPLEGEVFCFPETELKLLEEE